MTRVINYSNIAVYFIIGILLLTFIFLYFYKDKENDYFTDVAEKAGVEEPISTIESIVEQFEIPTYLTIAFGSAWGDYNNDNCIDLFVANPMGKNKLYKNNCDGTFTDKAHDAGLISSNRSVTASFGDIDNDMCIDLYIINIAQKNQLLHNNCDGTFTDITELSGTAGDEDAVPSSVVWIDYNNDGYLDIFVSHTYTNLKRGGNFVTAEKDSKTDFLVDSKKNYLFKNNGDRTFSEVGEMAGIAGNETRFSFFYMMQNNNITNKGINYSSAWFDYNNDLCIDALVLSNSGSNTLYKNNCNGTFTDISSDVFPIEYSTSQGIAVADINNDTLFDLYITNGRMDFMFVNNDGKFVDQSFAMGLYDESKNMKRKDDIQDFFHSYAKANGWGGIIP